MHKPTIISLLLSIPLLANHQRVCIKNIDPRTNLSKVQANKTLREIETVFENSLGKNVITITNGNNCHPINILYISKTDAQRRISNLKKAIGTKHKALNRIKNSLKNPKSKTSLKSKKKSYNRIRNSLLKYSRKLEILERSTNQVLGVAKGRRTTYKPSLTSQAQTIIKMESIDIYNYENPRKFKAVLAHELGHLIGADHTDARGSLMNPVLQYEQIKSLKLTKQDIAEFSKNIK